MYPILFNIPILNGIEVHSYGMMVALGFVCALIWLNFESKRLGQDPGKTMDLAFYVIVAAIVGSRILHVVVAERDRFFENPLMLFKIWEGGLVFYGGLIASLIVGIWYMRRHKMPVPLTCDIFAPAISIGHAMGRIGCLLAGCCFGRQVEHPAWYSIVFPVNPDSFAPGGVALYPTQLMEVVGEITIFWMLYVMRYHKRFNGQIIISYLMLYSALRFFNEFFRGDIDRGFLFGGLISTSQFISIVIFALGVFAYIKLWRCKIPPSPFSKGGAKGYPPF